MTWVFVAVVVLALGAGLFFYLRHKAATAPIIPVPLPPSELSQIAVAQYWNGLDGEHNEVNTAKHALYVEVPEPYGVLWQGRTDFTAPSLAGVFEPSTVAAGLAKRDRLKALNPNIKLGVQIGYTEGSDETTDFPPDHPWWLRINGVRQPGWGGSYLFNLSLPEVRQHCAECCKVAKDTGIWDFLFLDVFVDDPNHVDLLRQIRSLCGDWPIQVNCNYRICPNVAPLVNGIMMECGPLTTAAQWSAVRQAVEFNERKVRQPAINCLEISGSREDTAMMRRATCLALTCMNGYILYSDPVTHLHGWYPFWDIPLGRPVAPPTPFASMGAQRAFEHGTVYFNPPPGDAYII